eukprot:4760197-Prymnesium_polylepis.1
MAPATPASLTFCRSFLASLICSDAAVSTATGGTWVAMLARVVSEAGRTAVVKAAARCNTFVGAAASADAALPLMIHDGSSLRLASHARFAASSSVRAGV